MMRPVPTGPPIARDRLVALIDRMRSQRVLVVGDVMLDRYLIGETERLSPEAPVPVVTVRESRSALGGAGNVAANVVAIGAQALLAGVVGDDDNAVQIRAELATRRIDDRHLVAVAGRPTTTKTRVLARGQQVVRIDEETTTPLGGQDRERLLDQVRQLLPGVHGVVLEDYNKGVLDPEVITATIAEARTRRLPVVVDPKYRHFFCYRGATVFKPNRRELEAALGAAVDLEREHALAEVVERLGVEHLLLTLGAEGMVQVARTGETRHVPSTARDVYDVSGAGDTVTAWVATALAAGASMDDAAYVANVAAGVEVGKAGVATVTPDEVLAAHEQRYDALGRLRRGGVL